jgi:uncharacterized protein (TIGR02594 family)
MSKDAMSALQDALTDLGYPCGKVDGIWGAKTRAAVTALLSADGKPGQPDVTGAELPWVAQGRLVMGWHEVSDKARLSEFLRSDGKALGDPAVLPWCGDFVETCIKRALPDEPFTGDLGKNPYWARNWLMFGRVTQPTYGAVLVFGRDGGGHVGFAVGEEGSYFHVLGGNQSNTVSIAKIAKSRLLGARWPTSFEARPISLPQMKGGVITTNEA